MEGYCAWLLAQLESWDCYDVELPHRFCSSKHIKMSCSSIHSMCQLQNVYVQVRTTPVVLPASIFSLLCRLMGCKDDPKKKFTWNEHGCRLALHQPDT